MFDKGKKMAEFYFSLVAIVLTYLKMKILTVWSFLKLLVVGGRFVKRRTILK